MCSRVRIVSGNATETRPEMPQLSLPWRRRPRPVQTGCAGASERAGATRCAFRATLGAPRARSTLCILQSASGRPVRLPMRSACGWRRKSTGPARIRPGVTRSTEVSRASSLLHVARLNPRGPVEHDSSLLIDCGAERCGHPKWSQFAASHCIHTPTDPGALIVSRAGGCAPPVDCSQHIHRGCSIRRMCRLSMIMSLVAGALQRSGIAPNASPCARRSWEMVRVIQLALAAFPSALRPVHTRALQNERHSAE